MPVLPGSEHIVAAADCNLPIWPGADDLFQSLVGDGLDRLIGVYLPETLSFLFYADKIDGKFQTVATTLGEDGIRPVF